MTNGKGAGPKGRRSAPPKLAKAPLRASRGKVAKRFSVQRKMAVVARLLRGEPLELVARETNVSIARLSEWRERALAGAATALKERERDVDKFCRAIINYENAGRGRDQVQVRTERKTRRSSGTITHERRNRESGRA